MASHETKDTSIVLRVLRVLRRRWPILVVTVVAVTAFAVVFSQRETKEFQASSSVYLSQQNLAGALNGGSTQGVTDANALTRIAQTQAVAAHTPQLAARVIRRTGLRGVSPDQLLSRTEIKPSGVADILTFTMTAPSAAEAMQLSRAWAREYILFRTRLDTSSTRLARRQLADRLGQLRTDGRTGSAVYDDLLKSDQQLQSIEALQTANATAISLADSATQTRPAPVRTAVLAIVLGLVLGFGLMFLRETMDRRVRTEQELTELMTVPLLGRISAPRQGRRASPGITSIDDPVAAESEQFRMLRANVALSLLPSSERKTVLVTGAMESEGKSTVAANIAATWARTGKRVLVVDLDFRRPRLGTLFGIDPGVGITDVLRGDATLSEALIPVALTKDDALSAEAGQLTYLGTGIPPINPGETLVANEMHALIAEAESAFDIVVLDTPPITLFSDALTTAQMADAILLVAQRGRASRPAIRELRRVLSQLSTPVLGYVMTGAPAATAGYSYGGYAAGATKTEARV
jgi:capsular exopolysaccharide synthesis family protein